jgi:hypothetical protein
MALSVKVGSLPLRFASAWSGAQGFLFLSPLNEIVIP